MNIQKKIPDYVRVCMLSTLVWGILAHGMALVTKYSFQDDVTYLFSVGSTTVSGRWFLGIIDTLVRWFFGSPNFSLPLTGGLLTILFTGLCSCVIAAWMGLKKKSSWVLLSGLMVVFPIMSCLFFYLFTAPYYMFGLLLVLMGGSLLCRRRSVPAFVGAVVLECLGLSIYQAFMPVFLSLLLIYFFKDTAQRDRWTFSDLLREVLWYCGACVVTAVVYLLSVKISNSLIHAELLEYKGISSMGSASIYEYIKRVKLAFYLFLFPNQVDRCAYLLFYRLNDCYQLVLAGIALLTGWTILRQRKNPLKMATLLLVLAFFPLASNFIHVTCDAADIYSLMQFGQLAPFLFFICLADWMPPVLSDSRRKKALRAIPAVLMSVFCLFSVRVDNAVYTQAQFIQRRAQSYFTGLVTQIKSFPGYTSSTPVVIVGNPVGANDPTFLRIDGFAHISVAPLIYSGDPFAVAYYSWQDYLALWCGFSPVYEDEDHFAALPEVQAMPCYPDTGSIQMINNVIVVKISP